jgi:ABC-2 type transport system permease protein
MSPPAPAILTSHISHLTSAPGAIATIAYRDLVKFLRDPARMVAGFVLPLILIGVLGGTMRANVGAGLGYDYLVFTFTGVLAQTLFQSAAAGVISLIEDREDDFTQELFVSPISRYAIVFGKILGESLVALTQGVAILLFGLLIGVPLSAARLVALALAMLAACLLGGAFGIVFLANFTSQRTANQVFPFLLLPQYFLAGIFTPIRVLPIYLDVLSRVSPLRYAVDLTRSVYYAGRPEYPLVVLQGLASNAAVVAAMFAAFLVAGTALFVRNERNR